MKIGELVLCRKKDSDCAYEKRFIVDYLPSTHMISFGDSEYAEAVYYHNSNDWDIVKIEKGKQ